MRKNGGAGLQIERCIPLKVTTLIAYQELTDKISLSDCSTALGFILPKNFLKEDNDKSPSVYFFPFSPAFLSSFLGTVL